MKKSDAHEVLNSSQSPAGHLGKAIQVLGDVNSWTIGDDRVAQLHKSARCLSYWSTGFPQTHLTSQVLPYPVLSALCFFHCCISNCWYSLEFLLRRCVLFPLACMYFSNLILVSYMFKRRFWTFHTPLSGFTYMLNATLHFLLCRFCICINSL